MSFSDEAIHEIARLLLMSIKIQKISVLRRLHTILEKLLEDLSFEAPELSLDQMTITPEYVREKLGNIAKNEI